jgi:hypothetical protein
VLELADMAPLVKSFLKRRLRIWLGAFDYYRIPDSRKPFNGQHHRRLMFEEIIATCRPKALVETGTFRGTTTELMAATRLPLYTVESRARRFGYARQRLKGFANVKLTFGDSRAFLRDLLRRDELPDDRNFFYLDAHWGKDLPLAEEIDIIFSGWPKAIVMVDDFQVPGDDGYSFDDYGPGKALTAGYLSDLTSRFALAHFYPSCPSEKETGTRRGSIVIASAGDVISELATIKSLRGGLQTGNPLV